MSRPGLPERRTQAERSEETQRRILEAAYRLISERGYFGLRTADVADVAGVSRGALLHHFPNKDALVLATMRFAFQEALERSRARAGDAKADEDPLARIIADGRDFFFSQYFFTLLDLGLSADKTEAFKKEARRLAREYRLPVENAWLAVLCEAGLPPAFAEDVLWLTLSIVRGLAVRMIWQDEPERFDRLFALWRKVLWEYWERNKAGIRADQDRAPALPARARIP